MSINFKLEFKVINKNTKPFLNFDFNNSKIEKKYKNVLSIELFNNYKDNNSIKLIIKLIINLKKYNCKNNCYLFDFILKYLEFKPTNSLF